MLESNKNTNSCGSCDKTLTMMIFAAIICNMGCMIVAPFLPIEFEEKGISKEVVGLVFAFFPIGVIVISPVIGEFLEIAGRRFWIVGGLAFMGIIFIFIGLLSLSNNATFIVIMACIARFM